jgi:hypothetical protein
MEPAAADSTFSQLTYVQEALKDAEILLHFASETGITVDEDTKKSVLDARAAFAKGLDDTATAKLLTALARLASALSPVTPESIRKSKFAEKGPHNYRVWAIALAVLIVVYSTFSFVTSGIANLIHTDIQTANDLAVKLNAEFPPHDGMAPSIKEPPCPLAAGPAQAPKTPVTGVATPPSQAQSPPGGPTPPDSTNSFVAIKDLQLYAATIRDIDAHARELSIYWPSNWSSRHRQSNDPYHCMRDLPNELGRQFELHLPLTDYAQATLDRTFTYQKVRFFALKLADDVSFYYGAVSSCILPVLYALLGTFAYILRTFERQVSARSYVPSAADSARFVIAAIGGAVVGLFTNFTVGQGVKASPLATAFLVGYAVDVFYAFLETLIQSFTKTALGSAAPPRTPQPPPDPAKTT